MSSLKISEVSKQIGSAFILRGINLDVADGEFLVLLGPSGCGKTTLLRMIAGLEKLTSGEIYIDGERVGHLPPRVRDVAMVFQNYSLYMHKTVRENLSFGLKMRKVSRRETDQRIEQVAGLLRIESLLNRKPGELSGGEKQRVAIGRALARNPKLFLFDEPLSNLDASLRMELRTEIKRIHLRFLTTSIFVTHDQTEAMSMADRLVVMNKGRILQQGRAEEVYRNPQNLFVAAFLGNPGMNLLPARWVRVNRHMDLKIAETHLSFKNTGGPWFDYPNLKMDNDVVLGIRPEDIRLRKPESESFELPARVTIVERLGAETQLLAQHQAGEFRIRVQERIRLNPGDRITAYAAYEDVRLFDKTTEQLIKPVSNATGHRNY